MELAELLNLELMKLERDGWHLYELVNDGETAVYQGFRGLGEECAIFEFLGTLYPNGFDGQLTVVRYDFASQRHAFTVGAGEEVAF